MSLTIAPGGVAKTAVLVLDIGEDKTKYILFHNHPTAAPHHCRRLHPGDYLAGDKETRGVIREVSPLCSINRALMSVNVVRESKSVSSR